MAPAPTVLAPTEDESKRIKEVCWAASSHARRLGVKVADSI
jgi:hypothetical protein